MDRSILDLGRLAVLDRTVRMVAYHREDGMVGIGGEGRGVDIASKALARHLRVRRDGWWPHPETERVPLLEMKHCR